MQGSLKLKKAILSGKVTVLNPHSGEVHVFLYNSNAKKQFSVLVGAGEVLELAPKLIPASDISKSRNLDSLLDTGLLKLR